MVLHHFKLKYTIVLIVFFALVPSLLLNCDYEAFMEISEAPQLITPSDGSQILEEQVIFKWVPVEGVAEHHLYLNDELLASGNFTLDENGFMTYIPEEDLQENRDYTWYVVVQNQLQRASSEKSTFYLYRIVPVDPVIQISYPENGDVVSQSVNITGISISPNPIDRVEVSIAGDDFLEATGTTSWSYSWATTTRVDGYYFINARVYDVGGYYSNTVNTVFADNTPPTIQILTPMNNDIVQEEFYITGIADDNYELADISISIDGGDYASTAASAEWAFNQKAELSFGMHTVTARATDTAGLTSNHTINVQVDNSPPSISITSHTLGPYPPAIPDLVGGNVTITGTATDPESMVAKVEIKIGDSQFLEATPDSPPNDWNPWQFTFNSRAYGNSTYDVIARSTSVIGKTTSTSIRLEVDNSAPVIQITSHLEGDLVTGMETISGNTDGPHPVTLVEGRNLTPAPGSFTAAVGVDPFDWTFDMGTLPFGLQTFELRSTDSVGTTFTTTIELDVTGPTIDTRINNPLTGEFVQGSVNFTGVASSLLAPITQMDINFNAAGYNPVSDCTDLCGNYSGPWGHTWDTTLVNDGTYVVVVRATDSDTNTATDTITLYVDNNDPEITITNPAPSDTICGTAFTITGTSNDDFGAHNGEISSVDYRWDAGGWNPATDLGPEDYDSFQVVFDTSTLIDGTHTLTVRAIDWSGKITYDSVSVTVSNTPDIVVNNPAYYTKLSASPSYCNGDCLLDGVAYAPQTCGYTITNVRYRTQENANPWGGYTVVDAPDTGADISNWSHNLDTTALEDGTLLVRVRADNSIGRNDVAQITYYIDNNDPQVNIVNPADGSRVSAVICGGDCVLTGTASDTPGPPGGDGQITSVRILIDGNYIGDATSTSGDFDTWEFNGIDTSVYSDKTYTITAIATDWFNRTDVDAVNLTFDNEDPVVEINDPSDGDTILGFYTVYGTAKEYSPEQFLLCEDIEYRVFNDGAWSLWFDIDTAGGTCNAPRSETAWSFNLNTQSLVDGAALIQVRAMDSSGNQNTPPTAPLNLDEVSVTINNGDPPEVCVNSLGTNCGGYCGACGPVCTSACDGKYVIDCMVLEGTATAQPTKQITNMYVQLDSTPQKILSTTVPALPANSVDFTVDLTALGYAPLTPGNHFLWVYAIDNDGKLGTGYIFFTTPSPISITTASLPNITYNTAYNAQISATGGTGSYTYLETSGELAALGLNLNPATGEITGTVNDPVAFCSKYDLDFAVRDNTLPSTNPCGIADGTNSTLDIVANLVILTVSADMDIAEIGSAYNDTISATGGDCSLAYNWSISAGSVPDGLTLNNSGTKNTTVTGTPLLTALRSTATVRVDNGAQNDTQSITIRVRPWLNDTSPLPVADIGVLYTYNFDPRGGDGSYSFTTITDFIDGVSLNAAGTLSGTPATTACSDTYQVIVTSDGLNNIVQNFNLKVRPRLLCSLSPATGTIGNNYGYNLISDAQGGDCSYTFNTVSITEQEGGAATTDFELTAAGFIREEADDGVLDNTAVDTLVEVTLTSDGMTTAPCVYEVPVNLLFTRCPAAPPDATISVAYSWDYSSYTYGGTGSYTWSITAGDLPLELCTDTSYPCSTWDRWSFNGATGLLSGTSGWSRQDGLFGDATWPLTVRIQDTDGKILDTNCSFIVRANVESAPGWSGNCMCNNENVDDYPYGGNVPQGTAFTTLRCFQVEDAVTEVDRFSFTVVNGGYYRFYTEDNDSGAPFCDSSDMNDATYRISLDNGYGFSIGPLILGEAPYTSSCIPLNPGTYEFIVEDAGNDGWYWWKWYHSLGCP